MNIVGKSQQECIIYTLAAQSPNLDVRVIQGLKNCKLPVNKMEGTRRVDVKSFGNNSMSYLLNFALLFALSWIREEHSDELGRPDDV